MLAACTPAGKRDAVTDTTRGARVSVATADCFGRDSTVSIDVGAIGALRLDLPLSALRRLCTNVRDTTATGDETLDTAIVISRPGLSVVGRIATIGDDEGFRAVTIDSATRIERWTVTGRDGRLPGGVPLAATWGELARAYGPSRSFALNGDMYVKFCSGPRQLLFHIAAPAGDDTPNRDNSSSLAPALARARITSVDIPSRPIALSEADLCAKSR
jgi:hypothetical protein